MTPPKEEISQREYARRRGVTEGAIRKAVRDKRITLTASGKIDPAIADVEWAKNTLPRDGSSGVRTRVPGTQVRSTQALPPAVEVELEPQAHGGALKRSRATDESTEFDPDAPFDPLTMDLNDGRRIKEAALAGKHLVAYRVAIGELYPRDLIKRLVFADRRIARDALRHLARRVAPDLAEMGGDAAAIRERLEVEIESALNKLADDLPALLRAEVSEDADAPEAAA